MQDMLWGLLQQPPRTGVRASQLYYYRLYTYDDVVFFAVFWHRHAARRGSNGATDALDVIDRLLIYHTQTDSRIIRAGRTFV